MSIANCMDCADLRQGVALRSPCELTHAIGLLRERVRSGALLDITQPAHSPSGRFDNLPLTAPWPDYVEHYFHCSTCDHRFRLAVDTYRGSGGSIEGEVEPYQ